MGRAINHHQPFRFWNLGKAARNARKPKSIPRTILARHQEQLPSRQLLRRIPALRSQNHNTIESPWLRLRIRVCDRIPTQTSADRRNALSSDRMQISSRCYYVRGMVLVRSKRARRAVWIEPVPSKAQCKHQKSMIRKNLRLTLPALPPESASVRQNKTLRAVTV